MLFLTPIMLSCCKSVIKYVRFTDIPTETITDLFLKMFYWKQYFRNDIWIISLRIKYRITNTNVKFIIFYLIARLCIFMRVLSTHLFIRWIHIFFCSMIWMIFLQIFNSIWDILNWWMTLLFLFQFFIIYCDILGIYFVVIYNVIPFFEKVHSHFNQKIQFISFSIWFFSAYIQTIISLLSWRYVRFLTFFFISVILLRRTKILILNTHPQILHFEY